nr:CDP-alcohol phosphatidyltransferase family protein [Nitrospiraceae bacterium]
MISSRFSRRLEAPLAPVIRKIKINPNAITVAGFLVTSAGALLLASNFQAGGAVVLLGSLCDVLDGMVADLLQEGIHSHSEVREGAVAEMLVDVARQYDAGLIVIGTKGMEGVG